MNVPDPQVLDERIRRGLEAATAEVGEIDATELARMVRAPGPRSVPEAARGGRRPGRALGVAAALVLVAAVAAVGWRALGDDDATDRVTADRGPAPTGFAAWGPGWHEIDPGPVPVTWNTSVVFHDGRLVVAGNPPIDDEAPEDRPPPGAWSFDPTTRTWTTMPAPPFVELQAVVAAGDHLVALGTDGTWTETPFGPEVTWATLATGDDAWTPRGVVPIAPALRDVGTGVQGTGSISDVLVWTGQRLLHLGRGAVLDPATGTASIVEDFGDGADSSLYRYMHLVAGTPVWTGEEVVLLSWSDAPGLAWDALGGSLGEVDGPPGASSVRSNGAATAVMDRRVVLLPQSSTDPGAASYDPANRTWERFDGPPAGTTDWCPFDNAVVDDRWFVQPCGPDATDPPDPQVLDGDTWTPIPSPREDQRAMETWISAGDALVVWASESDTINNPEAPFRWGAVWV